jgi:agmatine deiminase
LFIVEVKAILAKKSMALGSILLITNIVALILLYIMIYLSFPKSLFICLLLLSLRVSAQTEPHFYTHDRQNRMAAEWEPALGAMVVWPLSVPYKLVAELSNDAMLYILVANETSQKEAQRWFMRWGMDLDKVKFIQAPQSVDAWWTRDWGPAVIFTPEKKMKLADGKYVYSTPNTGLSCTDSLKFLFMDGQKILKTDIEDAATAYLGRGLNIEVADLPFITTGGNVLTDGIGTAFSSCILLNENQFYGVSAPQFFELNKQWQGIDRYHILSNFEKRGIQHVDCLMKPLDEERIMVLEPPTDHELYPIYESIVKNELAQLKTPYGRPYQILRMKTGRFDKEQLAAYSNSLILNKTIYVPLFQIKEDSLALARWRELMPGYTVKGFEYLLANEPYLPTSVKNHYKVYGWDDGDALHCRTRAVWDAEMLFMSVKTIAQEVAVEDDKKVYVTLIDYSQKGLASDQAEVVWRVQGTTAWQRVKLNQEGHPQHFSAVIPCRQSGATVEYYVSATSLSGKTETKPRTAPAGMYQFKIR